MIYKGQWNHVQNITGEEMFIEAGKMMKKLDVLYGRVPSSWYEHVVRHPMFSFIMFTGCRIVTLLPEVKCMSFAIFDGTFYGHKHSGVFD